MASPPKPWERQGAAPASSATATMIPPTSTPTAAPAAAPASSAVATSTTSTSTPAIPARPASLTAAVNQNASAYSGLGTGVGANPYSSYGTAYSSPYSSPYSRMGTYGGYGGMGGMYGGGYGGYGGMGGMYGGGMYGGMPGQMNDPNSLTNRFNTSTAATFQMLEGVVGAFGGFAQMLESTYMATHSSFFAMVSVAEQFGNLRDTLGSVLGIFTLMRWIRTLLAKITGRPPPADATSLTPAAFARFEGRALPPGPDGTTPPRPSRKPLFFFVLAAFGLPYLMSKVIKSLAASHEEEEKRRLLQQQQLAIDPAQLEFCRLLYDFAPQPQAPGAPLVQDVDLAVRKGDLVAVLSKSDPMGNPSEWWRCRARDGRTGYLPSNFLEVARRPGAVAAIKGAGESESGSRTSSLVSSVNSPPATAAGTSMRAMVEQSAPALPGGKAGGVSVEGFQKSQFYNGSS